MSTIADLPPTAKMLTGPGNNWQGTQDASTREERFTWVVPWGDSNAFYAAAVGTPTAIPAGNGLSITRRVPLRHPYNPAMWMTKLAWEGRAARYQPKGAAAGYILFTATFGYVGYSIGGEQAGQQSGFPPFVKITSRAATRVVTDPSRKYTATNPNGTSQQATAVVINQPVAVQFGGNAFQITLFRIPDLVTWQTLVAPLCGTVNSKPFALGAFTRDAGSVLFEGYGFEEEVDAAGNMTWTGTVDLHCSSLPWNSIFLAGSIAKLTPAPYPLADHNTLYI